jgi:hypothetical protein
MNEVTSLSTKNKSSDTAFSTHKEYMAMAEKYVGGKVKNKDVLTELAFNLLEDKKEMEKVMAAKDVEMEKVVAAKEMEKVVAGVVATKEMEKMIAITEEKKSNMRAYYLKKLSIVSQRLVS